MFRPNKIFNRKLFVFFLCLVIATIVWSINKLTKDYTFDLPYKVCIYSSTNTTEPMCANNVMYVRVVASGFYILKKRIKVEELTIDIKRIRLSRTVDENNVSEYILPTALILNAVKEIVGNAVRMEAIVTEELSFNNSN